MTENAFRRRSIEQVARVLQACQKAVLPQGIDKQGEVVLRPARFVLQRRQRQTRKVELRFRKVLEREQNLEHGRVAQAPLRP